MYPVILDIYGPIKINSFSACILLSLIVFLYLVTKDKNAIKFFSKNDIINLISETAIAAILGGRLLHVINNHENYSSIIDIISIWNGGLAVMGALLSGVAYLAFILYKKKLSIIYVFDIASAYLPIIHAISRIGCFLAGCCYGIACDKFWAVNSMHPTQIYSSLAFFSIFLIMQFLYSRYKLNKLMPGTLFSTYLILSSLERFGIDFLRAEREYYAIFGYISKAQIQASLMLFIALIAFIVSCNRQKNKYEYI